MLVLGLIVYALDLARLRDACLYAVWLSVLIVSCATVWTGLWHSSHSTMFLTLVRSGVTALWYTVTAVWVTVQCQWLVKNSNSGSAMPQQLEGALHGFLPVLFAALVTATAVMQEQLFPDEDVAATAAPHAFGVCLVVGTVSHGAAASSFAATPAIHHRVAWGHSALLLFVPPLVHLITSGGRLFSWHNGTFYDLCDFVLVCVIPYLLWCGVQQYGPERSPYAQHSNKTATNTLLVGTHAGGVPAPPTALLDSHEPALFVPFHRRPNACLALVLLLDARHSVGLGGHVDVGSEIVLLFNWQ